MIRVVLVLILENLTEFACGSTSLNIGSSKLFTTPVPASSLSMVTPAGNWIVISNELMFLFNVFRYNLTDPCWLGSMFNCAMGAVLVGKVKKKDTSSPVARCLTSCCFCE